MSRKPNGLFFAALILGFMAFTVVLHRWAVSEAPADFVATTVQAAESHTTESPGSEGATATHGEAAGGHGEETEAAGHGDASGDTHGDAAHDGEHAKSHTPHLPSFLDLIIGAIPGGADSSVGHYLKLFTPTIFGILIAIVLAILFQTASRNMTLVPGRLQNLVEYVVGGLANFLLEIIGPQGKRFVPFCGTLFIYIFVMNFFGLVPLLHSPTSHIEMTAALALIVFLYVQYTALRMNGVKGVLYHLAGEPKDVTTWLLVPLLLPIHMVGELAKPFSLAVRLFGNISGEDTLIAVFVGIGALAIPAILGAMGIDTGGAIPLGIPLQVPLVFLALLLGSIQALVFTLLAAIYFSLVMPHGHDEH